MFTKKNASSSTCSCSQCLAKTIDPEMSFALGVIAAFFAGSPKQVLAGLCARHQELLREFVDTLVKAEAEASATPKPSESVPPPAAAN